MIDHVGFSVSDYAHAKAFYERALAPLGYKLVMETTANQTGQPAAGFGSDGKPDFWIGGEGKLDKPLHIAIAAKDRATVDAFYRAALAAGGKDNGPPGVRSHYHPDYYGAILMDTISKQSVTRRLDWTAGCDGDRLSGGRRPWPGLRRVRSSGGLIGTFLAARLSECPYLI
jgi:catechol 2,3-dioxygenase-like lactoylglutathione lyase family enzyme